MTDVFPSKVRPALAAVDIADSVVSGSHTAVHGFAFNHVYTVRWWDGQTRTVEPS